MYLVSDSGPSCFSYNIISLLKILGSRMFSLHGRRKHFDIEAANTKTYCMQIKHFIILFTIYLHFYCKTKKTHLSYFLHNSCPYKIHKQHNVWEWNPLPSLETVCLLAWKCTIFRCQRSIFSFNNAKLTKICASVASARNISEVCFFICHVSRVSCWELHIFNVNIEVCV